MKQFMCILSWLMLEDTYAHYDNWSLRDKTTDTKERTKRETETLDTMSWFWIVAAIIVGVLALLIAVSMITQSPPATNILLRWRKRKSGGQRQKPSVDEEFPLGQLYHRNGQGGIISNSDINVKQTGDTFISRQIAAKINDALLAGHSKGTMNPAFINDENRKPADSCNVTLCSKDSKDKENDSNLEKLSTLKVVSITEAEENEYSSSSKTPNVEVNLKSEENGHIKKGTDINEKSDLSDIADCNENKKEDVGKAKTAESSSGLGLSMGTQDAVLLTKSVDNFEENKDKIVLSAQEVNDITAPPISACSYINLRFSSNESLDHGNQKVIKNACESFVLPEC